MGVDCNITERLLFQNMGQLKHNRTFVISENEVSFELSSQICTQDNKKYVIQRIPFICKDIHTVKSFIFVGLKFRGLEFKNEFVDI